MVTDKTGKAVGAVPAEAFDQMRDELEHYASYLVNLLVKNDMVSLPVSTKGGSPSGQRDSTSGLHLALHRLVDIEAPFLQIPSMNRLRFQSSWRASMD